MSKQKTEVKVIVTSHLEGKNLVTKHNGRDDKAKMKSAMNTSSRFHSTEMESAFILKTPTRSSNSATVVTPRTPAAATQVIPPVTTPRFSDSHTAAPCTRVTSDSQGTMTCHSVPSPLPSSKRSTVRANRTPLQFAASKNPGMSTPRVSSSKLPVDPKASAQAKSSSGRSSMSTKILSGSSTPTQGNTRRSSANQPRYSNPMHRSSGGSSQLLTPDVVTCYSARSPTSPVVDNHYGGAESTTVSVGVRVRPLSDREQSSLEVENIIDVVNNSIRVTTGSGTRHSFSYDHCFWSYDECQPSLASQRAVYNALAQPLLEKAYEGYNTCLFAYGQTGSGKSYTMLGEDSHDDPDLGVPLAAGVIPRFCRDLFNKADYLHSQNPPEDQLPQCRVEVEISYIEIYNERIYDLLGSGGSRSDHREPLRVREHPDNGPYVEGVAHHLISSYNDLQTWLLLGNKERSIAATGVNDKSSRSHAVFTIRLTQMQIEDVEGEQLESSKVSIINLVDLAGSERVAAAQSQGDRLKEGVCINKSLLTLGKVITALAESEGRRRPFIPYRESVLTYLLKESLGGNSRTAMIATVSPCNIHVEETLSTLRYAQQARKIVNHNYINEDPTALIIRSLKEEVERLRLQQLRSPSLISEAEFLEDEEILEEGENNKEKALIERENAIIQKEKEKDEAVMEKEREIAVLREQLRCHQLLSEKTNRSLEQRLKETEAQQQEAMESLHRLGIASEKETGPVLINLSEDPQLSETLSYRLKNGTTSIGHSHCDLTLHGLHTENIHCSIFSENDHLKLFPKIDADTYINGRLVTSPQTLHHNDRLVLAGIYYFRVNNPGNGKNSSQDSSKKMDFYFTKEELLKEQERRLQKEAEVAVAASKAEMEQEMFHQRNKLLHDVEEARSQLLKKQNLVCELEGTQWKLKEEKRLLEEQILRDREIAQSLDISLQSPTFPHSNFLKEVEAVFNETVQEVRRESTTVSPPMLSFKIREANQICKKLKKPYEFMMQEILNESGLEVVVLVKDLQHQMTATLTRTAFTEKLQVLRDIIQGEECEDEMFEASLLWERTEDVSCVPGFINKLLECPSLHALNPLNCSISKSSSSFPRSNVNRRRSSVLCVAESSSFIGNLNTGASCGSVIVAAAIHQALTNLPAPNPQMPPLTSALNAVADLHGVTQNIRDHTTEPGHRLSDEELSKQLILLLCTSQTAVSSLISVANIEFMASWRKDVKLQDKLRRAASKITSCTSRLFQGLKNEVDSLVEEESGMLTTLAPTVISDIARLAILLPSPVPDFTKLKPRGLLCKKFTDGLRSGLDWLVINSGDSVSKTTDLLGALAHELPDRFQNPDALLSAGHTATSAIAAFLKNFAHMNATIEYDESLPEEDQRLKIVRWVNRVESAADTISQLTAACRTVMNQFELSHQGKMNAENFKGAVEELNTRLQHLMSFAGLSPVPVDGLEDCSFSSNSDIENSQEFMSNLHAVACRSVRAVQKLQSFINNAPESCLSESRAMKYNKNLVAHWPRNSEEYIQHLKQLTAQKKSQMKSSLRSSSSTSSEEKRVRFDVSFNSSSSISCFEEIDTVDV
ncbi:kinesin-like protein KIF14 [Panulirus ornatus]|uniref:kinesin-like protein KIF14 n=1 Tax=Panulirus ornatus TaxID=150431 RepID=UPI003A851B0D